jgi:hypothetical protein
MRRRWLRCKRAKLGVVPLGRLRRMGRSDSTARRTQAKADGWRLGHRSTPDIGRPSTKGTGRLRRLTSLGCPQTVLPSPLSEQRHLAVQTGMTCSFAVRRSSSHVRVNEQWMEADFEGGAKRLTMK